MTAPGGNALRTGCFAALVWVSSLDKPELIRQVSKDLAARYPLTPGSLVQLAGRLPSSFDRYSKSLSLAFYLLLFSGISRRR